MQVLVMEIYAYHGPSVESVLDDVHEANTIYEHPRFLAAAKSLDELPHPLQVAEARQHFGEDRQLTEDEENAVACLRLLDPSNVEQLTQSGFSRETAITAAVAASDEEFVRVARALLGV